MKGVDETIVSMLAAVSVACLLYLLKFDISR